MKGYFLPTRCPHCGGLLDHINASKVNAGTACSAVARCVDCHQEFGVFVQLRPLQRQGRVA